MEVHLYTALLYPDFSMCIFLAAAVRIGYEEHMPGQVRYVAVASFLGTNFV